MKSETIYRTVIIMLLSATVVVQCFILSSVSRIPPPPPTMGDLWAARSDGKRSKELRNLVPVVTVQGGVDVSGKVEVEGEVGISDTVNVSVMNASLDVKIDQNTGPLDVQVVR